MNSTIWNFGSDVFENGLLSFIIRTCFVMIAAIVLDRITKKAFKKAEEKNEFKTAEVSLQFGAKIVRFLIYLVAAFAVLSDISMFKGLGTAVLGATSVFSVIVGLAAQESFGNFIAGFFLALYHPFNVGDTIYLKEQGIEGVVNQITFRQTEIKTVGGTLIVVPNSVMNNAVIENKNYSRETYNTSVSFLVPFETDMELLNRQVSVVSQQMEEIIDKRSKEDQKKGLPKVSVLVSNYDLNGMQCVIYFDVKDMYQAAPVASKFRTALMKSFKENGITLSATRVDVVHR